MERMKDLNARNEQILKENEKTLKEAGQRLLDKVAEFTKELGSEGIHASELTTRTHSSFSLGSQTDGNGLSVVHVHCFAKPRG